MRLNIDRDREMRRQTMAAIGLRLPVSSKHIEVTVKDGLTILEGEVAWQYQRQWAERAAECPGEPQRVDNRLRLTSRAEPSAITRRVEELCRGNTEPGATSKKQAAKARLRSWIAPDRAAEWPSASRGE